MRPSRKPLSSLSALGQRTEAPPIAWLMQHTLENPGIISLAAGFTDNPTLPVADTRRIVTTLLQGRRTGEPALQYGTTGGLPELRRLTAQRVLAQDRDAVAAHTPEVPLAETPYSPAHTIITSGSQQLLYLLTEVLCDPGDIVIVEDPTYFVYLGIAQSHGLDCRGVPLREDGIDLEALEATLEGLRKAGELKRLKLLYLVTYHQNPTGRTTTFERKRKVMDLLQHYERSAGHPLYLLEDAAYRELRFSGPDVPSALAVPGTDDRVLLAGTFSKPFATGLRVGFGVLPEPLLSQVLHVKSNHDFGTSSLLQHVLATALAGDVYDRHVQSLRRRYQRKAGWMTRAMRRSFPDTVRWQDPTGGLYVWAAAPRKVRTGLKSRLFRHALDHQVLYVPGRLCYANDPLRRPPDHEMRLSFGNASRPEIELGIERLAAAIRELH
jgi:2-aminoadipate transaminase